MQQFNFNVTNKAFERLKTIAEKQNNLTPVLRVSVAGGGCSGFSYKYDFVQETSSDDFFITKSLGSTTIKVVIDSLSQQFLDNSTFDFIEELGNSYFQISNPNAQVKCGCGNSFGI